MWKRKEKQLIEQYTLNNKSVVVLRTSHHCACKDRSCPTERSLALLLSLSLSLPCVGASRCRCRRRCRRCCCILPRPVYNTNNLCLTLQGNSRWERALAKSSIDMLMKIYFQLLLTLFIVCFCEQAHTHIGTGNGNDCQFTLFLFMFFLSLRYHKQRNSLRFLWPGAEASARLLATRTHK